MPMILKSISALEPRMRGQLFDGLSAAPRPLNHGWAATDSEWMQRRHNWYGLDHDSSWLKSTLRSSSCCLLTFISQPRFILTVSWPCGVTWQQLAAHVFPVEAAAGHQKLINYWCRKDIRKGVRGRSAWLLQQSIIWCQRGPPVTFAECTECGGKIHHWCEIVFTVTSLLCCVIFIGYLCDKG